MLFFLGLFEMILYVCRRKLLTDVNMKNFKEGLMVIDNFISLRRCAK